MTLTLDDVDPELRAATERMQRTRMPPRAVIRALLPLLPVRSTPGVHVETVRIGANRARVHRPERPTSSAALLWIHGGGLVIGDAKQDEALCGSTAVRLGITVVAANYRLAPEHPFPAALDDVRAAWDFTLAAAGVDPARVALGGESAGAGLAAALAQRLHDEGDDPVAQWLFAPMLDDRTAARRELDGGGHFVWDNTANRDGWSGYLGGEPGAAAVPAYAVPARREDLTGLPPAFLTWGDIELFAEEDAAYAAALAAAGVDVVTDVVPGAPHGFENWARASRPAQALVHRAQDWLAERLGVPITDRP